MEEFSWLKCGGTVLELIKRKEVSQRLTFMHLCFLSMGVIWPDPSSSCGHDFSTLMDYTL